MMVDYFTEVFPVNIDKVGDLTAYTVTMKKGHPVTMMDDLLSRLVKAFSGNWIWDGSSIITDNAPSPVQVEITLDLLRKEHQQIFGSLDAVTELTNWQPTAEDAARFMACVCEGTYDNTIRSILRSHGTRLHNGYVMRDYLIKGWEVDGQPAISFTIVSRILHLQALKAIIEQQISLIGRSVIDRTQARNIGKITALHGTLANQREILLNSTLSNSMKTIIMDAEDDTTVITVDFGNYQQDYVATALTLVLQPDDYTDFGLAEHAIKDASRLSPEEMAKMVSGASDILKTEGIIGNAFNNRVNPAHFIYLDHVPEMEFGDKSVRPYKIETLANEFTTHKLFGQHPRFKSDPIRIAVINTLDGSLASDFVEAMRRQLEKDFGLAIEMIKQRNVRVVSGKNLASAMRVVEKENPNVLLACFADDETDSYDYVHSLTLGKGIALQALYERTMHNPDAMGWVIMGILAKTGNTPFVLAEGFDAANLVVGLDWVREPLTWGDRLVGLSRIYRRDGFFMRYFMDIHELETDAMPPETMLQTLFPAAIFNGKKVMIHHRGTIPDALLRVLSNWSEEIDANFIPVEIHTHHVPHVYGLDNGITQAPWGSVFLLNAAEAFIVSSSPNKQQMPQPIHIRLRGGDVSIEQATYSVLAMTLLSYGTKTLPRLPVTIQNGDKLANWLGRGMLPKNINGDIAFWL